MSKLIQRLKWILVMGASMPCLCFAQAGEKVELVARLEEETVPLNREARLTVEARWHGKAGDLTIDAIDEPKLTNLKLIATSTANRVSRENQALVTKRIYEYMLQGQNLGMAYIEEMRLRYTDAEGDAHMLETPRLSLTIVDPVAGPLRNYSLPITVGAVLVLATAAVAILLINDRKKHRVQQHLDSQQDKPLEEAYREKLHETVDLQANDLSQQYQNLAQLLRQYLNAALALETKLTTTEELLRQIQAKQIEMKKVTSIQEILQACDLNKFSGGAADRGQLSHLFEQFEELLQEPMQSENRVEHS